MPLHVIAGTRIAVRRRSVVRLVGVEVDSVPAAFEQFYSLHLVDPLAETDGTGVLDRASKRHRHGEWCVLLAAQRLLIIQRCTTG